MTLNLSTSRPAERPTLADRLAPATERIADASAYIARTIAPAVELTMRLWLAQYFLRAGMLKLIDPDPTVWLVTFVAPLPGIAPETATALLTGIEIVAPLLLVFGLLSRLSAAALLAGTTLSIVAYPAIADNLVIAGLLGLIVAAGPGHLSLDHKFRPALTSSALPFTALASSVRRILNVAVAPVYRTALRIGIGVLLLAPVFHLPGLSSYAESVFQTMGETRSAAAILVISGFLALGLCTRLAALSLAGVLIGISVTGGGQAGWLILLLIVVAASQPGPLSLDHAIATAVRRRLPSLQAWQDDAPHVVIVGGGFGGIAAALGLARTRANVTLIDRRNYHLFQPLLYQVATASLSPADIATPIRTLLRGAPNCRVVMGRVTDVDTERGAVVLGTRRVAYDYLVLATGAKHSYFGKDAWEPFAPGLKKIDDATEVRRKILTAFENAETAEDESERKRLMTFVIVGGGPTGVELAGAIAELARHGMADEFRRIDPHDARIILVQSADRLLPAMPERLSANAREALEGLGVEVRTGGRVEDIDSRGATVAGVRVDAGTVIWAAGVAASAAGRWVGAERDRAGRVLVNPDLSIAELGNVFAVGDTAACANGSGGYLPGLAAVAKQQGIYIARLLRARVEGRPLPGPFRYRDFGSMATIGREKAVGDLRIVRVTGLLAWWLWCIVHVAFMADARNRTSVVLDWVWSYMTLGRRIRLITGGEPDPITPPAE